MLERIEQDKFDLIINIEIIPPKYNKIWGPDYFLMDSKNFPGNKSPEEYEKIISMFMNIWNVVDYRVLSK